MFGYVRPLKSKLSEGEEARFRAVYCGLCHALGRRYGSSMRLILNYDLAFLALVLGAFHEDPPFCHARCVAKPVKGRDYREPDPALLLAADLSVILTYFKLSDTASDESFFKSLAARASKLFMRRKYKKASSLHPGFDATVREQLNRLAGIEREGDPSLDKAADTFAIMLSAAAKESSLPENDERILTQFFYHLGRFIYLVDACNDLGEDMEKKRYNPVALRFSLKSPELTEELRSTLSFTLDNSLSNIAAAYELLTLSRDSDVIRNILYFGLRAVSYQVLSGTFGKKVQR